MSDVRRELGRPPGPTAETLAKGRLYLSLLDYGISLTAIAARENVARSEVHRLITLVRPLAAVGSAQEAVVNPDAPPRSKPKMAEGTLLRRAFAAIRNVRAFKGLLDAETREFWVEALIEIRALADDGIELTFGRPGDVYHSQAEFLSVFEGITPASLEKLFSHAMLVDLGGEGVAMPYRWELRGKPANPARRPARNPDQLQPSLYGVVPGGLSGSGDRPLSPDSESGESRLYPDGSGDFIRTDEATLSGQTGGLFPDSSQFAGGATTTTTTQENQPLGRSRRPEGRAFESGESRGLESGKSPLGESGESRPDQSIPTPTAVSIANQVGELCGYGDPHAADVETVRSWLALPGISEAVILQAIRDDRDQPNPLPVRSLALFTKVIKGALSVAKARDGRKSPSSTAPPAAAPPLSEADKALKERLQATKHRSPPSLADFLAEKTAPLAARWLDLCESCVRSARSDVRLPDFSLASLSRASFEADMLAAEEALTEPEEAG